MRAECGADFDAVLRLDESKPIFTHVSVIPQYLYENTNQVQIPDIEIVFESNLTIGELRNYLLKKDGSGDHHVMRESLNYKDSYTGELYYTGWSDIYTEEEFLIDDDEDFEYQQQEDDPCSDEDEEMINVDL